MRILIPEKKTKNVLRTNRLNCFSFFLSIFHSCKERDQYAKGCHTVSQSPFQMGMATTLDPALDLQRLNALIISNMDELKQLNNPKNAFTEEITSPEDIRLLNKNAMALTDAADNLQKIHIKYRTKIDRELKYGSRLAPIGDDNYLHFMRTGLGLVSASATLPTLKHNSLSLDHSPRHFIRNDLMRSSLANDKMTHY